MSRFEERLASDTPIVADGGMGALLSSAVAGLRCPEEANLRAPESVLEVHLGYIRAGAELIETNSFGANRAKLARQFLADELEQINCSRRAHRARGAGGRRPRRLHRAARSARSATSSSAAATGRALRRAGAVLEGRGVDLFMVETFYDLDELETAIDAVRSRLVAADRRAADVRRGRRDARRRDARRRPAARLRPLGLAAFGANHGAGPAAALTALAQMRGDGDVLAALPNVGLASMRRPADRLPARDARVLRRVRRAGARARRAA